MPDRESPYGNALERVCQRLAFHAAGMPTEVSLEELADVVGGQSVAERRRWLKREGGALLQRPQVGLALARLLAHRAAAWREEHPERGVHLGRAAVQIAEHQRAEKPLAAALADARAQAWMQLANAQRLVGELEAAEASWQRVDGVCPEARRDALLAAEMAECKAVLRRDQGRFRDAEELLRAAIVRYEGPLADRVRAVRARIVLGHTLHAAGRLQEAFWETWRAGEQIDPAEAPRLVLDILHNHILIFAELGRPQHALFVLRKALFLYRHLAEPIFQLRTLWVVGRLLSGLEAWAAAAEYMKVVRAGFLERDMPYDAALASLDLALAYARLRQDLKVRKLAAEMYPVFLSERIPREASATLILFADSAEDWRATPELIARCIAALDALQRPSRPALVS